MADTQSASAKRPRPPLAIRAGRGVLVVFGIFLTIVLGAYVGGFRMNFTASFPIGLYKLDRGASYSIGDLVLACPGNTPVMRFARDRGYVRHGTCEGGFRPLLKRVVANEGDVVEVTSTVRVNGGPLVNSDVRSADSVGRPLTAWEGGEVSAGHILLMSDYEARSFDGRYIGPIPAQNVQGTMRLIWSW